MAVELRKPTEQESTGSAPHLSVVAATEPKAPRRVVFGVSLLLGVTLLGAGMPAVFRPVAAHAGPTQAQIAISEGKDADDAPYHWHDPRYASEECLQIGGIAALLAGTGLATAIGRWNRRRRYSREA